MTSGLRRGELAGLRWEEIRFHLIIMAQRSVVDQVVGSVKTEASKRPIPIDAYVAEDLLSWYRTTKYSRPEDYVFATRQLRGPPQSWGHCSIWSLSELARRGCGRAEESLAIMG